jgi:hypothetical protein
MVLYSSSLCHHSFLGIAASREYPSSRAMVKRPKVPAALHSELSEYSSLLRALRTSNTLDLASQLTSNGCATPAASARVYEDDFVESPVLNEEGESERPFTETATDSLGRAEGSVQSEDTEVRKLKRKASKAKAPKDTWTRWPLLAGDMRVPEWSFQDEIKLLVTQALKAQRVDTRRTPSTDYVMPLKRPSSDDVPPEASSSAVMSASLADAGLDTQSSDEEEDIDSVLTPPVLDALAASSGHYLCQILALLAAYVPAGEKSMQNRLHPINWESVLDVVAANGLLDQQFVHICIWLQSMANVCSVVQMLSGNDS